MPYLQPRWWLSAVNSFGLDWRYTSLKIILKKKWSVGPSAAAALWKSSHENETNWDSTITLQPPGPAPRGSIHTAAPPLILMTQDTTAPRWLRSDLLPTLLHRGDTHQAPHWTPCLMTKVVAVARAKVYKVSFKLYILHRTERFNYYALLAQIYL